MQIINRRIIEKFLRKNRGNKKLAIEVDKLISSISNANWDKPENIKMDRPDADHVHVEGFYFFNIDQARAMILIEIEEDQATIVWCGNHQEYETAFKNNKNTIKKWLKARSWI